MALQRGDPPPLPQPPTAPKLFFFILLVISCASVLISTKRLGSTACEPVVRLPGSWFIVAGPTAIKHQCGNVLVISGASVLIGALTLSAPKQLGPRTLTGERVMFLFLLLGGSLVVLLTLPNLGVEVPREESATIRGTMLGIWAFRTHDAREHFWAQRVCARSRDPGQSPSERNYAEMSATWRDKTRAEGMENKTRKHTGHLAKAALYERMPAPHGRGERGTMLMTFLPERCRLLTCFLTVEARTAALHREI